MSKKSIARLNLHTPKGAAEGWKDDAFDKFDVDGKGSIDFTEFTFALAQTVMAYKKVDPSVEVIDCIKEVLTKTQEAQTEAKDGVAAVASGTKDEYETDAKRKALANKAEVEALHAKSE